MILPFVKKFISKYIKKNNIEKAETITLDNDYSEEVIKNIPNLKSSKIVALDRYYLQELIKKEIRNSAKWKRM